MAFQNGKPISLSSQQLQILKTEAALPAYANMDTANLADTMNGARMIDNPMPAVMVSLPGNDVIKQFADRMFAAGVCDQKQYNAVTAVPDPAWQAMVPAGSRAFELFPGQYLVLEASDFQ